MSGLIAAADRLASTTTALLYVSSGYVEVDLQQLSSIADTASRNVRVFPIDVRPVEFEAARDPGLTAGRWLDYRAASQRALQLLADRTGGLLVETGQAADEAVARIHRHVR